MPHYVGLDASKATTSICILDEEGALVRQGVVETNPRAIVGFLRGEGRRYRRVGLEAISFAPWIYEGLAKAGLPVICIEALHAHGVLQARRNKTDRNDARGIAQMMRAGSYKAVHVKTAASQEAKLLHTARKHLVGKCRDVDNLTRAALLQFGHKLPRTPIRAFERRAANLAPKGSQLRQVVGALLAVHHVLEVQIAVLEKAIREVVAADPICQRLMTAPGMGPLTVLPFRAAVDVAARFSRSRDVGVHLGLTPRAFRSGTIERRGRISKCGDRDARGALYLAATSLLQKRARRQSALREWGKRVVVARGYRKG